MKIPFFLQPPSALWVNNGGHTLHKKAFLHKKHSHCRIYFSVFFFSISLAISLCWGQGICNSFAWVYQKMDLRFDLGKPVEVAEVIKIASLLQITYWSYRKGIYLLFKQSKYCAWISNYNLVHRYSLQNVLSAWPFLKELSNLGKTMMGRGVIL